ncbi:hypothetical protein [Streptomyces sp. NPDC001250]|uniref:hypothetical protein n=1 Tax=unclassified Streptomyces TaxID=2593676 RepID=UPI003325775C
MDTLTAPHLDAVLFGIPGADTSGHLAAAYGTLCRGLAGIGVRAVQGAEHEQLHTAWRRLQQAPTAPCRIPPDRYRMRASHRAEEIRQVTLLHLPPDALPPTGTETDRTRSLDRAFATCGALIICLPARQLADQDGTPGLTGLTLRLHKTLTERTAPLSVAFAFTHDPALPGAPDDLRPALPGGPADLPPAVRELLDYTAAMSHVSAAVIHIRPGASGQDHAAPLLWSLLHGSTRTASETPSPAHTRTAFNSRSAVPAAVSGARAGARWGPTGMVVGAVIGATLGGAVGGLPANPDSENRPQGPTDTVTAPKTGTATPDWKARAEQLLRASSMIPLMIPLGADPMPSDRGEGGR